MITKIDGIMTPQLINSKNHSEDYNDPGTIIERTQSDRISLKTILLNQAQLEFSNSYEKEIAEILIDYIDPSGLITEDLTGN